MRSLKTIAVFVVAVLVVAIIAVAGYFAWSKREGDERQQALQSFYQTPSPLPAGKPGDVLRSEPITSGFTLPPGTQAQRILYLTQGPSGEPRVSSGMVFIPAGAAPEGGRKVSWAHPTVGMGDACAPSRTDSHNLMSWLPGMLNLGWVVTATDYAGLGTDGTELYLVGKSEAYDVINAVQAAQRLPGTGAGSDYAVFDIPKVATRRCGPVRWPRNMPLSSSWSAWWARRPLRRCRIWWTSCGTRTPPG